MANIDKYLSAISVGGQVTAITDNLSDSFKSGAYAAFVQSITGEVPRVVKIDDKRAKIILTESQNKIMQKWFENQIIKGFTKAETPPSVVYEIGPVFKPLALKYTIPFGIGLLITGFALGKIV